MQRYRPLVETVLSGGAADVCPVFFWKHHPVADQAADTLAAATIAFQERFDCDIIKITPSSTYQLPDYGLRDAWAGCGIGRRVILNTVVQQPGDWTRLPSLNPRSGFTGHLAGTAGMVRQDCPWRMPVVMTVFNPLFQAASLAGLARLQDHMRDCPDAVEAGLRRLTANTVALIERLAADGVDGIFLATQHAVAGIFTAAEYARFGLPGDRACLDAAAGLPFNMLHLHGEGIHAEIFDDFADVTLHYDSVAGNPAPARWLAAGFAVGTGPSPTLLASDQPASAIADACEAILAERGRGRILLSAGCSVPLDVAADRLDAITATARIAAYA